MIKKIKFLKLFNHWDNYPNEIRFEVFRWMLSTGWEYRDTCGVFEQIWGLSSINSQDYWFDHGFLNYSYAVNMNLAFIRAIISDDCSPLIKQWREDNSIGIDEVRYLNLRVSDKYIEDKLKILFNAYKSKLTVQLNEYCPQAINIDCVLLSPDQNEWQARLKYGYNGSSWTHILTKQGDNTFYDFLCEACRELEKLTKK